MAQAERLARRLAHLARKSVSLRATPRNPLTGLTGNGRFMFYFSRSGRASGRARALARWSFPAELNRIH